MIDNIDAANARIAELEERDEDTATLMNVAKQLITHGTAVHGWTRDLWNLRRRYNEGLAIDDPWGLAPGTFAIDDTNGPHLGERRYRVLADWMAAAGIDLDITLSLTIDETDHRKATVTELVVAEGRQHGDPDWCVRDQNDMAVRVVREVTVSDACPIVDMWRTTPEPSASEARRLSAQADILAIFNIATPSMRENTERRNPVDPIAESA